VSCGLLVGGGRSIHAQDGIPDVPSETGSDVLQKTIYMCASGVRASIKSVDFRYNGTGNYLPNLEVVDIRDKVYDDEQSRPMWAVEASEPQRMTFDPLWGIVDDSYEVTEGFSTMRAEKLWLPPAVTMSFGGRSGYDSLAAISAPALTLQGLYSALADNSQYTEDSNYMYPLVERFAELSSNQSSASKIPSLIITDSLASLLVGTKTAIRSDPFPFPARLSVNDDPAGQLSRARVVVYRHALGYDLRYAIPGFAALVLLALTVVWAIYVVLFSRGRILATLTDMYNQSSTGRLAVGLLRPGRTDPTEPSKSWVHGDGGLKLKFGRIRHRMMDDFVVISEDKVVLSSGFQPPGFQSPGYQSPGHQPSAFQTHSYIQQGPGFTPVSPISDSKGSGFDHTVQYSY
jgi:hypothetical protein